ncbi:MAG: hypothetical protein ACI90U_000482 [Pseudomonadales bacterium]|jgi:hypothetical protein
MLVGVILAALLAITQSVYLLYKGIPIVMKIPAEQSFFYQCNDCSWDGYNYLYYVRNSRFIGYGFRSDIY